MSQLRDTYWPDVRIRAAAEKAARDAALTAFCVAGITALLSALAWLDVLRIVSPWSILDALVFTVVGVFIVRRSRIAALLGLLIYLLESMAGLLSGASKSAGGAVLAVIFTLFFINGLRGTMALARMSQRSAGEPADERAR